MRRQVLLLTAHFLFFQGGFLNFAKKSAEAYGFQRANLTL